MNLISAYYTDEGRVKNVNQDSLCIKAGVLNGDNVILAAVCDGMGGLSDGETASAYIISGISKWFESTLPDMLRNKVGILDVRQNMDKHLHSLNDKLNSYSTISGKTMGTTMTAVLIILSMGKMITAHVGDSRLYKIKDDNTEIVTTDHSVIYEEIRKGKLNEEDAVNENRQNQLTKCMGAGLKNVSYDYIISPYEINCVYMLCTDGFIKKITKDEIADRLKPSVISNDIIARDNLKRLTELNLNRNETDNITSLLIKLQS